MIEMKAELMAQFEKRPRLIKDREQKRQELITRAFEAERGGKDDSDLQGQKRV